MRHLLLLALLGAAPDAPDPRLAKVQPQLARLHKLAADPAVLKAVKAQNAKKQSMDEIKALDAKWMAAQGVADFMKPYLEGPCVEALKRFKAEQPGAVEAFAMDDQGGLVCSLARSSDYWQGDEAKWQKSFNGGKGQDFVDKPRFDESSQAYSVQVSVPVKDGSKTVGALMVGFDLDRL